MTIRIVKDSKYLLVIMMSMALACQNSVATNTNDITTMYAKSDEIFPNPERGFFIPVEQISNNLVSPLNFSELQKFRSESENVSLVRRTYLMSEFREQPLSQDFLEMISMDCEVARKAGVKLIIVFTYNWIGGGSDASKNRILSHLDQLKPVLTANYDVITYMEAGFIGYWGEWNRSTNGLDTNRKNRKDVLFKILSVLPTKRMVALRYAHYKRDAFNNENPLTPPEAFNGSYRARTGAINNCFLASIDDWGTYNHTNPEILDKQKAFLNLDNRFVVQGGEVCNPSKYDDCPNALNELERMHWSTLSIKVYDGAEILKDWEEQGCIEEIKRRLGYRFRLLKSVADSQVRPGGTFSMSFEITNDGWASAYNPRNLEVILRNSQTLEEYYLPIKEEPRMWMPGTTKLVNITGGIPVNIPEGEYQVLLNLPDPTPRLYNRPEYSIRLANQNVWEASTGYNSLLHSVIVAPAAGDDYLGEDFFRTR